MSWTAILDGAVLLALGGIGGLLVRLISRLAGIDTSLALLEQQMKRVVSDMESEKQVRADTNKEIFSRLHEFENHLRRSL